MKSLLVLRHINVQNANAIAGLTWGFPGISNFLGFSHALSRFVEHAHDGLTLGGCAVICHDHQVHAHQPLGFGEHVFALTRNPLTKEGKTAPFNEEARMQLDITLMIECDFSVNGFDFGTDDAEQDTALFENQLKRHILKQRLAGGTITHVQQVAFTPIDESPQERRQQMRKLLLQSLPGFALVDRTALLAEHHAKLCAQNPDTELLDAWLDFSALTTRAEPELQENEVLSDKTKADWRYVDKPAAGYLVPITVGYRAISELYPAGVVGNARDADTPFCFVESAYGVGQWLSPHRADDIEHLLWRYQIQDAWYLCKNDYASFLAKTANTQVELSSEIE